MRHSYLALLFFHFLGGLVGTFIYQISPVYAEECSTLIPLYQNSLKQLAEGEKVFLAQGCSDEPGSPKCKKVAMAIREMQGSVMMFSLRLKALKCHPEYSAPKTPCQRLKVMQDKANQKLDHIQSQYKAQQCTHSVFLPQCKQLKSQKKVQIGLLRALHLKIQKKQCFGQSLPKNKP